LERLKRRQEALQMQLSDLRLEFERLSTRLNAAPSPVPEIAPLEMPPLEIPPEPVRATPPPLPPVVPASMPPASCRENATEPLTSATILSTPSRQDAGGTVEPRESFEMKLGTYWLVRVGIVMLLTGLVFLGTYAYKNFIGKLGPGGKVALLYAAGAALLGAGAWLQRKREYEAMRNYGQVLFAGGLATVYFTTYAAHYVPVLRVIASPLVDALLLLAWSAVIVWIADRRKSEILALFAIGLSYYTSAITDVGLFTLYSNLVLTAAAVFFLIRNRWTTLSFISLVATYGGFAFWRFHHGDWSWAARTSELWPANFFMGGYWLLFTAAVFLARGTPLANVNRAVFASLNNGAFFGLVVLSMLHVSRGNFWKFSLGFGVALLVAAALARRWLASEPVVKNSYLVQGLTLVTVGFIACFTGLKLALVLAAESIALTFLGQQRANWFLRGGAYVTAALSVAWTVPFMKDLSSDLLLGWSIGTGLLFNAWWEHRHDVARGTQALRPCSGYFAALALLVWAVVTWHATPREWLPVAWMLEAVALTASFYVLRIPDVPVLAQGFAVAAQGLWFFEFALRRDKPHWLVPAALIAGTLALSHWWQRQKRLTFSRDTINVLQIAYGLALVGVLFFWFKPEFAPAAWLAFLCLLAVGVTLYAVATRAWALAACAQLFLLISSIELLRLAVAEKPAWHFALVPIVTWLALGIATTAWLTRHDARDDVRRPLLQVSAFYRAVAVAMSIWWVFAYVPRADQFCTFCVVGLAVLALAGALRHQETLAFAAVFLAVGFGTWFVAALADRSVVNWRNGLALVAVLAAQQIIRRLPDRFAIDASAHSASVIVTGAALWLFVSKWVVLTAGTHFLLTVSWAGVAALLFALGFLLRERMHRWLGLIILACAVTRVFASDVWKLETIYRILSFMALGVVLLALGFVYTKYQDKIRQWL